MSRSGLGIELILVAVERVHQRSIKRKHNEIPSGCGRIDAPDLRLTEKRFSLLTLHLLALRRYRCDFLSGSFRTRHSLLTTHRDLRRTLAHGLGRMAG